MGYRESYGASGFGPLGWVGSFFTNFFPSYRETPRGQQATDLNKRLGDIANEPKILDAQLRAERAKQRIRDNDARARYAYQRQQHGDADGGASFSGQGEQSGMGVLGTGTVVAAALAGFGLVYKLASSLFEGVPLLVASAFAAVGFGILGKKTYDAVAGTFQNKAPALASGENTEPAPSVPGHEKSATHGVTAAAMADVNLAQSGKLASPATPPPKNPITSSVPQKSTSGFQLG
ncbi:MAG: hypothetical protein KGI29_00325 [Pseudomonadota bacterium]|nr:hypothetical protein [Pseudomonadota bacterium]MDE3038500.1 hypothetical protein [Pseudomonadota bacterium]